MQDLQLQYEDGRTLFNARINAWIFALKERRSFRFDQDAEVAHLGQAMNKIATFSAAADKILMSAACLRKVYWKDIAVAAIAIVPALVDAISRFSSPQSEDEKERAALVKTLEQHLIAEWAQISPYIAYDLRNESFIPWQQVTDTIAKQPTTAIYLNKWTLKPEAARFVSKEKDLPEPISDAYMLYTGSFQDLRRLTLTDNSQ